MHWTELPSLNSLRAFAAVAETGSYARAGSLLHVTHAAVSQQVRGLEDRLGVRLVVRQGRGITLTADGLALARELAAGLVTIRRGVETLKETSRRRPVRLSTSPAFAAQWLMPRLHDFYERHPDVPLMLDPTSKVVELKPDGTDLAIRYRGARRARPRGTPVLVSDMVVIGASSLLRGREFGQPALLADMPWLQELGTSEVSDWFEYRGVGLERSLNVSQMPGNLIMQAVRRGDGITYTARAFFEAEIQSGAMTVLFSEPGFGTYYIETSPRPLRSAVKAVADWLGEQASLDAGAGS